MKRVVPFFLFVSILAAWSCTLRNLEKNLDPDSKEFLSEVRFIITKQERKVFLNLPPSDREAFIEEFWIKRDPDPDTEINEFKEQYYERIEDANRLFTEGATPGWLQDRGRVYITLGPPDHRAVYPRGRTQYDIPTEIWYYHFFTIVFQDEAWNGIYKLAPYSAQHIAEINRAQVDWQPKPKMTQDDILFDCELKVREESDGEVTFQVEIPYRYIWFAEKKGMLETTIAFSLQVLSSDNEEIWRQQGDEPISLSEEKFEELIGEKHMIEVNATFEPGDYYLIAEIENKTDGKRVRKTARFDL